VTSKEKAVKELGIDLKWYKKQIPHIQRKVVLEAMYKKEKGK
jgi:hypothetical protein